MDFLIVLRPWEGEVICEVDDGARECLHLIPIYTLHSKGLETQNIRILICSFEIRYLNSLSVRMTYVYDSYAFLKTEKVQIVQPNIFQKQLLCLLNQS